MTIAGHTTSISLEPIFWRALEERAQADGLPYSALVARIDAERIAADAPPNLASAIRCWLLASVISPARPEEGPSNLSFNPESRRPAP